MRQPTDAVVSVEHGLLQVQGLTFGYGRGTPLIDSCSAVLQPGRLCVLLGPNAAGKSTLLRLMLGELSPWQGRVTLDGRPVAMLSAGERARRISYVPQRGGTGFAFTVWEVVSMGRHALAVIDGAAERALHRCDLEDVRDRIYSQLSVGQQQRVLLARAMAQSEGGGQVMLLDEPGSAMDLRHVHRMMAELGQLARDGLAVLVVLHDLNLAARYADDLWLMDQGRLVAAGPWREVLADDLLASVYQIPLTRLAGEKDGRPVFIAGDTQYTEA